VSICILDDAHSTAFLKIKIPLPIYVPNESIWAFPACSQGSFPPWFLHFDHRFTCNKTFKSMLTFPGGIGPSLFLLRLFHIEQNIFVDARYEFHFLQKMRCSHFNINIIISRNS
jgi:hypothetical protein